MSYIFETFDDALRSIEAERDPKQLLEFLTNLFDVSSVYVDGRAKIDSAIYAYENSPKGVLDKADAHAVLKPYANSSYTSLFADREEVKRLAEETKVTDAEVRECYASAGESFFNEHVTTDLTGVMEMRDRTREARINKEAAAASLMWEVNQKIVQAGIIRSGHEIPGFAQAKLAMMEATGKPEYQDKWRAYYMLIINAARDAMPQEQAERIDELVSKYDLAIEEHQKARQEYIEREEGLYREITAGLLESSPVSQEEAIEWAKNSTDFTDAALKRLESKASYPKEQVIADMAELYRLLGGKLGPILFQTDDKHYGKSRASSDGKLLINVSTDFDKRTLYHETGHVYEGADGTLLQASHDFIKSRATGEPQKLSKLCNNRAYRANEIAFPDNFISPYVGKIYPDASEVVSMSVERLANPEKLMEVAAKDGEHLKLLLGEIVTRRQSTAATTSKSSQQFSEKKQKAQAVKELAAAWDKWLDKVAGPDFERVLLKKDAEGRPIPFEGHYLDKDDYCSRVYLYKKYDNGGVTQYASGKSKQVRRYAYFEIAVEKGLMPAREERSYGRLAYGHYGDTPPSWFDPEKGLPSLVDTGDVAKAQKAWRKEVKRVVTKELEERLLEARGWKGFRLSAFGLRKWDEERGTWEHVYAGESSRMTIKAMRELGTRYVYFHLASEKGLLPVVLKADDIRALAQSKSDAPSWFAELKELPEIA